MLQKHAFARLKQRASNSDYRQFFSKAVRIFIPANCRYTASAENSTSIKLVQNRGMDELAPELHRRMAHGLRSSLRRVDLVGGDGCFICIIQDSHLRPTIPCVLARTTGWHPSMALTHDTTSSIAGKRHTEKQTDRQTDTHTRARAHKK